MAERLRKPAKARTQKRKSEKAGITSPQSMKLQAAGLAKFQSKENAAAKWGVGSFERWELDQNHGIVKFVNADGTGIYAEAQVIGSFDPLNQTWEWAWNNPYVAQPLKVDALKVKAYGEEKHLADLTTPKFSANESTALGFAGFALTIAAADAVYRGKAADITIIVSFRNVKNLMKKAA